MPDSESNNGKKRTRRRISEATIRRRKREQRVEDFILKGMTNQSQIAIAMGISQQAVSQYFESIRKKWNSDSRRSNEKLREYVWRFHYAAYQAFLSYEKSRQDAEEIVTSYEQVVCKECKGSGMESEEVWCESCSGTGKKTVEHVTRKVRGQAGDSSFLRTFKECMVEAAKLEGLYPKTTVNVNKVQANVGVQIGLTDLSRVPTERLLEIRKVVAKLAEPPITVESTPIIDVESVGIPKVERGKEDGHESEDRSP